MRRLESKPERLDIEHYYWNPFSLTIQMYNEDGSDYSLTDSQITAGVKSSESASSFAVSFSESHEDGNIVLTASSASLLAELTAGVTYYWDFRIDDKSYIGGKFKLSEKADRRAGTSINLTYKDADILRLTISDTAIGYMRMIVGTTAERNALDLGSSAKVVFLDTDENTFYVWRGDTQTWI